MSIRPLVLVGGGGHCRSCLNVAEELDVPIFGILDPQATGSIYQHPILGGDEWISQQADLQQLQFLLTVGMVGSSALRQKLYLQLQQQHVAFATLIARSAWVSRHAQVEQGTAVLAFAMVNASAFVGENVIVNTAALIEHDAHVGAHSHIATRAVINGGARVGQGCMVGSNAVVLQGVQIADHVVIGAGSTVVKDIHESGTWVGSPARRIK